MVEGCDPTLEVVFRAGMPLKINPSLWFDVSSRQGTDDDSASVMDRVEEDDEEEEKRRTTRRRRRVPLQTRMPWPLPRMPWPLPNRSPPRRRWPSRRPSCRQVRQRAEMKSNARLGLRVWEGE